MVYAVWKRDRKTVTFDANKGELGTVPETVQVDKGSSLGDAFPDAEPTRADYVFKGWATTKDAEEANFTKDTKVIEDIRVYAVWKEKPVEMKTVIFDANEGQLGEVPASVQVEKGKTLNEKFPTQEPTREGYTFEGWSKKKNAKHPDFFSDTVVNEDITVYAVWEKKAAEMKTVTFDEIGRAHV